MKKWSQNPFVSLSHVSRFLVTAFWAVLLFLCYFALSGSDGFCSESAFLSNPYLSFSPSRTGFTFSLGDTNIDYKEHSRYYGYRKNVRGSIGTGNAGAGYHTYTGEVHGLVPVSYWEIGRAPGQCNHSNPSFNLKFCDVDKMGANIQNCGRYYNPGWFGYCAYCGKKINDGLIYMPEWVAASVSYIPAGVSYANYFYLCPFDYSLEQGISISHVCSLTSANRYRVVYNPNGATSGSMPAEYFYTDNSATYEGGNSGAKANLRGLGYAREGYIFKGWSLTPGGSEVFADKESWINIQNATGMKNKANNSTLNLYAVWEVAFDMSAEVKRLLKDVDGNDTFKRGESGELTIVTKGYADYVEVIFPDELSEYNTVFDHRDNPVKTAEDKLEFMIPLYDTPGGEWVFNITVIAHKGEKQIRKTPEVRVLSDATVLNELETGLR
jgi:hypothetical protein